MDIPRVYVGYADASGAGLKDTNPFSGPCLGEDDLPVSCDMICLAGDGNKRGDSCTKDSDCHTNGSDDGGCGEPKTCVGGGDEGNLCTEDDDCIDHYCEYFRRQLAEVSSVEAVLAEIDSR